MTPPRGFTSVREKGQRSYGLVWLVGVAICVTMSCSDTRRATEPLRVNNGTSLTLTVLVNGQPVSVLSPASGAVEISPALLPAWPWYVQLQSPSGRRLLELTVRPESVTRTTGSGGQVAIQGAAARVDLSCGRLDVWVGPPLAGPPPESGSPGDCD